LVKLVVGDIYQVLRRSSRGKAGKRWKSTRVVVSLGWKGADMLSFLRVEDSIERVEGRNRYIVEKLCQILGDMRSFPRKSQAPEVVNELFT
jgi:hypothetical protein